MAIQPYFKTTTLANFSLGGGPVYGTAAMIAKAGFGIENTVKLYSSLTEIKQEFKAGELVEAANKFFIGGGQVLSVVRIAGTDKTKASVILKNGSTDEITIEGKYTGTYGNNITVQVKTNGSNKDIIITDGITVERYLDLDSNTNIVNSINLKSTLVSATKIADDLIDEITPINLSGGDDGDTLTTDDYVSIINDKLMTKDWDYLLIPGKTEDAFHTTISGLMDNRALDENKYSIYVTGVDKFEVINTTINRTASNSEGRLVVVHTALFNGETEDDKFDENKWLDATYTAALYTGTLCKLDVSISPTFKSLPMIGGKKITINEYNKAERDSLISNGFTIIDKTFTNTYGTILAVTRTTSGKWNEMLDNQRKVDFIRESVYDKTKSFIGNPNDESTRKTINSIISNFLNGIASDRIIETYSTEVLKGSDPRSININTSVKLVNELDYISFNLILNI